MADSFADKFYPPGYFPPGYFQGGEQDPGAMSASLSGSGALSGLADARQSDRGGDGFPSSGKARKARKAKSAERLRTYLKASKPLVYLKHLATEVDEPAPELVARRITKAVIADAVSETPFWAQWTNATAVDVLPTEILVPPESGISQHDIALAIAGYLRDLADEDDIEMLLLAA